MRESVERGSAREVGVPAMLNRECTRTKNKQLHRVVYNLLNYSIYAAKKHSHTPKAHWFRTSSWGWYQQVLARQLDSNANAGRRKIKGSVAFVPADGTRPPEAARVFSRPPTLFRQSCLELNCGRLHGLARTTVNEQALSTRKKDTKLRD